MLASIHPSSLLTLTIPRCQNETPCPVFATEPNFLLLQHAERLAREILAVDFFGVENVAQFVAGETVETGVVGIQLGAELGAADFIPTRKFHQGDIHVNQPLLFSNEFDPIRLVALELIDKNHPSHFLNP